MSENSIDSIVCDPPYGIGILNKSWDKEIPALAIWQECHRVLKPGGHILAFSSARLYHRLAVAMEDAGFDTFNMLAWIYGSGFPKGKNLSREFDRSEDIPKPDDAFRKYLRDAIKRSPYKIVELERICGTKGIFNHYLGKSQPIYPSKRVWDILKDMLNLDGTYDQFFEELEVKRVAHKKGNKNTNVRFLSGVDRDAKEYEPQTELAKKWKGWRYGKQTLRPSMEPIYFGQKPPIRPVPRNVEKWGVGAVNIDGTMSPGADGSLRMPSSVMADEELEILESEGIDKTLSRFPPDQFFCVEKPNKGERGGNSHPTVKPVSLMRQLVRLVTPLEGTCLDPFMGSGTTGVACQIEELGFVGIERNENFFEVAENRIFPETELRIA